MRKKVQNMREKTSTSRSKQRLLFTEDEIVVAEILVDLPRLFRMLESGYSFKWCSKRRRSGFNESTPTRPKSAAKEVSSTASPVTALACSPSESDGKSARAFRKCSIEKVLDSAMSYIVEAFSMQSREKYCAMIDELRERRDLLRQEIENYNSAWKEALNRYQRKEVEKSDFGGRDEFGIPDLNICAEEAFGVDVCEPLDLRVRRAGFAAARRRRMDIMKIKSVKLGRTR